MTETLHHWADGAVLKGSADRLADVTDPAVGDVTKRVALATADDAAGEVARTCSRAR